MKKSKGVCNSLICSVLSFICLLVFFDMVDASPKKPESVQVIYIGDITGPYAPVTGPTWFGMQDVTEYINNELGGIDGVPMEGIVKDDGGRIAVGISHYMTVRQMKQRPASVYVGVSALGEALRDRVAEDKIPCMSVPATGAVYPAKYTFGWFPLYADLFGAYIDWLKETWDKPRAPRIAFLTWDNTYGKACLTPEAYAYAKSKGVEIVATEVFSPPDVFVGTQILRIRNKKADWIYTNTSATGPPVIAKSARESGLRINLAGGLGQEWSTIYIGGRNMDGAITAFSFASLDDENHPGVKTLMRYFNKNKRKKFDRTVLYEISWALALTTREAVLRIVKESGWKNVNGETIKKELERMKDFRPLDLTSYTFTPKKHAPDSAYISRITDGKIVPITGWRTCPDLRPQESK